MEAVRAITRENWLNIYNATKETQEYYPAIIASQWQLATEISYKTITIEGKDYQRWIKIYDTSRDLSTGDIEEVYNISHDDPSSQKIIITVVAPNGFTFILTGYFTRWENEIEAQDDWSGGNYESSTDVEPEVSIELTPY